MATLSKNVTIASPETGWTTPQTFVAGQTYPGNIPEWAARLILNDTAWVDGEAPFDEPEPAGDQAVDAGALAVAINAIPLSGLIDIDSTDRAPDTILKWVPLDGGEGGFEYVPIPEVAEGGGGGAGPTHPRVSVSSTLRASGEFETAVDGGGLGVFSFAQQGLILGRGNDTPTAAAMVFDYRRSGGDVFDRKPEIQAQAWAQTLGTGGWQSYVIFGDVGWDPDTLAETNKHFGFKYRFLGGALELRATNADGTAQTQTLIGIDQAGNGPASDVPVTGAASLAAIHDGDAIRFYVDGVLLATHTTDLPHGALGAGRSMSIAWESIAGFDEAYLRVFSIGYSYEG